MDKIQQYPDLQILPMGKVRLHEHHDPQRTPPLIERLGIGGVLHNPPLVTPFSNGANEFMVMDGANRVTALKELDFRHILAQVVVPDVHEIKLMTWNHVIWNIDTKTLVDKINHIEGISVKSITTPTISFNSQVVALMQTVDYALYEISVEDRNERIPMLNSLVSAYKEIARFDRTMIEDISNLGGYFTKLAALIIYPRFSIQEVIENCRSNNLFPAGITRFIVSPRALRVNYPLDELRNSEPLEVKRERLEAFIRHRMSIKGIRVYTETTVLYDE